jgi:cobalt-zinc-cadmium efflux system outer membrane protein
MRHRQIVLLGLQVVCSIQFGGCVTVDPRPDFNRAEQMAVARTGVDRVYNPETLSTVEDAIAVLLADGLTTNEAVQVALLNNRRLQALFQEIGVSRADVVQSGLLSNPSFGLSARFPEGGGRSNLTLTFAQQLVDLWQIPVRRRIAEADLEQTILNVVHQANDLATDVRRRCYHLIALGQMEEIAGETLELAERSLKLAEDRFGAGDVGQVDVNLARAAMLDVKSQIMAIRRDRRIAQTTLAHAIGLARWRDPWTLDDSLPQLALPIDEGNSLLWFAMSERLDAQAAAIKVRGAEDEVRRQCLSIFPNVTLGVEWERQERRALPGRNILADTARATVANGRLTAPAIQSRAEREQERRQIIDSLLGPTLDITLPIWDQNQAQIAKARFQAVQARKEYEEILDGVARDIDEALIVAKSATELVQFVEEQVLPNARANVEAARRAYHAGQQGIIALIDAQKDLIAQRETHVAARRDYAVALAELRRAAGGRLPSETNDEPNTKAREQVQTATP